MLQWIGENYKAIIGIITIIGAIGGFFLKIFKYVKLHIVDKLASLENSQASFKLIQDANALILKELQPNGGSTIKDQIRAIRTDIGYIKSRELSRIYIDSQAQWECDQNGHCIRVNKAWVDLTGISENDAAGNGWIKAVHDGDKQRVYDQWLEAIHNNNSFLMRFRIRNSTSGNVQHVKAVADIKRNEKREIEYILGTVEIIEDETDRIYKTNT